MLASVACFAPSIRVHLVRIHLGVPNSERVIEIHHYQSH